MIEHRITFTDEELVASATQDNLSIRPSPALYALPNCPPLLPPISAFPLATPREIP